MVTVWTFLITDSQFCIRIFRFKGIGLNFTSHVDGEIEVYGYCFPCIWIRKCLTLSTGDVVCADWLMNSRMATDGVAQNGGEFKVILGNSYLVWSKSVINMRYICFLILQKIGIHHHHGTDKFSAKYPFKLILLILQKGRQGVNHHNCRNSIYGSMGKQFWVKFLQHAFDVTLPFGTLMTSKGFHWMSGGRESAKMFWRPFPG